MTDKWLWRNLNSSLCVVACDDHAFLDKSHIMTVFDQFQIHISQNQGSVAREVNDYSANACFPKQVGGQTKQGAEA